MKNLLILITLISLSFSCNQKNKEEKVQEIETQTEQTPQKPEEQPKSSDNESKQPNWSYDPYGYLTYDLDSLGLKYETISDEIFQSRYKESEWVYLKNSEITQFYISSDTILNINTFRFEIDFDEKMNYNENAGSHYGGIAEMRVIKNGKQIQQLRNIEDIRALGVIEITFYDINLDGHIDMSFILSEGKGNFYEYYIFNPTRDRFEHYREWDYIRPNLYNKSLKQFLTIPYGTAIVGEFALYQINGNNIKEIKTFHYHPINGKEGSFITIVNHN